MSTVRSIRKAPPLVVRPLRPGDRDALAQGFAELSAESRERRFLMPKPRLSEAELDYLVHIDHHTHEALVAIDPATRRGVGVARYAGWSEGGAAEIAFTVADDWHGRGVATLLCDQLLERAREEGVERLVAMTEMDNLASQALLTKLGFVPTGWSDGIVDYELDLVPATLALAAAA